MAPLAQAPVPLRKVVLLEGLEVRALLGKGRHRVAVEPHPSLAPAPVAIGNERALLNGVEGVKPSAQAGV